MEHRINIAELLKDCPRGMELYSPIFGKVYLDEIRPHLAIVVTTDKYKEEFLYDGRYGMNGECMLFPSKDKITWEGFVPPGKFKDGDIVFYDNCVSIFKEWGDETLFRSYVKVDIDSRPVLCDGTRSYGKGIKREARFATEEEKEKLFNVIKEKGYKWNPETKTLEKFKNGDILFVDTNDDDDDDDCFKYTFILKEMDGRKVIAHCYTTAEDYFKPREVYLVDNTYPIRFATEDEKKKLFDTIKEDGLRWNDETKTLEELTVPRFKVGDRVQWRDPRIDRSINVIESLESDRYRLDDGGYIKFGDERFYNLLKFDINTLKPFDKVLVRYRSTEKWGIQFFEKYDKTCSHPFVCMECKYTQCIPYNGNEYLLDSTDECSEYYKNWEG